MRWSRDPLSHPPSRSTAAEIAISPTGPAAPRTTTTVLLFRVDAAPAPPKGRSPVGADVGPGTPAGLGRTLSGSTRKAAVALGRAPGIGLTAVGAGG